MPILIDQTRKAKMLAAGVSTLHATPFMLPVAAEFEPPCSLKWMNVEHSLRLGAFSYAVSGYYFGASIGRYTSIGEGVQVGRGSHPVSWASSSPIFYQNHQAVVDFIIPEASNHKVQAPYIAPRTTVIGNDVYIGHGAFISQGVTIGNGAVIGAHAMVTKDVPDYAVVVGNPGVVKRMRLPDAVIDRMLRIAWWRFAFWDLAGAPIENPERFLDVVEQRATQGLIEYRPNLLQVAALGP